MEEKNNGCYIASALILMFVIALVWWTVDAVRHPADNALGIVFVVILIVFGILSWLVRNNNK